MSTSEVSRQWKDQLVELTTTEFVLSVTDDEPPVGPEPPGTSLRLYDTSEWLRNQRTNLLYYTLRKDINMSAKQTNSVALDLHKTRVQLDMSPVELQRLNWVMEVCDLSTRKELFNVALTLLEWATKETNEGRRIASFDDRTNDRFILSMPALSAASQHHRRYAGPELSSRAEPKTASALETNGSSSGEAKHSGMPLGAALAR